MKKLTFFNILIFSLELIFAQDINLDSIQQNKQTVNFAKWSTAISYKLGICYTGEDLVKTSSDPYNPFKWLYWLNTLDVQILHHSSERNAVGFSLGYGWTQLKQRRWSGHLKHFTIGLIKNLNSFSYGGIELIYAQGRRVEYKYDFETLTVIDSTKVTRSCIGAGLLYSLSLPEKISKGVNISPVLSLKLAIVREYANNAPSEWSQMKRLTINFSGIYIGVKFNWRT